jgi:hypothetical protein
MRISASFHASRRDKPSSDTAWETIRKISFNPTSRRSSHPQPGQDRPGAYRTLDRAPHSLCLGGTGFRHLTITVKVTDPVFESLGRPMVTESTSTAIVPVQPVFTAAEPLALTGFLAGYADLTREAYALDLRQYASWCQLRDLRLFQARRADIECFARDLEAKGRARATITRRLCTIAGFYKYAVEEELLEHSPAAHVRRPRLDDESHATGLDRNELGALLVAAGLGPAPEHALISLLALNGLRVSEATGANTEALGQERGHRTLTITRKGGKIVTIPLAPAPPAPSTSRSVNGPRARCSSPQMAGGWTGTAPRGSFAASPAAPGSPKPLGRTR